ncbi:MAG: CrcB family protein [Deltaproteobacteria bacterium]|nr:CrcB family protein [Deltaproteobacteria bacterium]
MRVFYIGIFGLLGVFSRYFMGLAVGRALAPPFPYATFAINIAGAFLIGVVYVLGIERNGIPLDVRIGIMVGFLGGFTTFSSYCLEFARLIEEGEYWYAALYFGFSNVAGVLATFAGLVVARFLFRATT